VPAVRIGARDLTCEQFQELLDDADGFKAAVKEGVAKQSQLGNARAGSALMLTEADDAASPGAADTRSHADASFVHGEFTFFADLGPTQLDAAERAELLYGQRTLCFVHSERDPKLLRSDSQFDAAVRKRYASDLVAYREWSELERWRKHGAKREEDENKGENKGENEAGEDREGDLQGRQDVPGEKATSRTESEIDQNEYNQEQEEYNQELDDLEQELGGIMNQEQENLDEVK